MTERKRTLVIVPTYNEAGNLEPPKMSLRIVIEAFTYVTRLALQEARGRASWGGESEGQP